MTRRKIALLCAAFAMALSGCSNGEKAMLPAGTLRCAADISSAEMTELAEYIAAEIGVECVTIQSDSESAFSLLENNQADIAVFPYPESSGMDSKFIGNIPFAEKQVYCIHRSDISLTAASDGSGLITGASEELYDEAKKTVLSGAGDGGRIYCSNAGRAAEMFADGTLDVYYCYSDEAAELLENNAALRCTQPADIPPENVSTVVLRSSEKLYSAVNSAIESYLNSRR